MAGLVGVSWGTDTDNRVGVPHPRSLPGLPKGTGALPLPMGVFSPDQNTHSKNVQWVAESQFTGKGTLMQLRNEKKKNKPLKKRQVAGKSINFLNMESVLRVYS